MFGNKLPPKLRAKLDAKAMRKFEAAQAGERPKGLSGIFSRGSMPAAGTNFSNPKMMADMAAKAQANMPAAGAPTMGAPAMGGRYGVTDRGENTKDFKKGGKVKKMAKGGSASRRADGCATQGKTKGRFV